MAEQRRGAAVRNLNVSEKVGQCLWIVQDRTGIAACPTSARIGRVMRGIGTAGTGKELVQINDLSVTYRFVFLRSWPEAQRHEGFVP